MQEVNKTSSESDKHNERFDQPDIINSKAKQAEEYNFYTKSIVPAYEENPLDDKIGEVIEGTSILLTTNLLSLIKRQCRFSNLRM